MTFVLVHSENKYQKEHDIACNKMRDWKRRFEKTLDENMKKIKEFGSKDRMSEADKHLADLEDMTIKIEEFREEVNNFENSLTLLNVSTS